MNAYPERDRLSVAPMMDWTDRHYRYLMRQITRQTLLYSEMVTTGAVLHGDRERLLGFSPVEKPLVLQLGGDDPAALASCARIAAAWGYDEVNLNVGCPSVRVKTGNFGACLMAQPDLVADCVQAMSEAAGIPVSVKHRIGIDTRDRFEDLEAFVSRVARAPAARFIVHARKAWLTGLSPKENRTVPELRYHDVYRLKRTHPRLRIELNGGVTSLAEVREHLRHVDGVMVGRWAYERPYALAPADGELSGGAAAPPNRREVVERMLPYIEAMLWRGVPLSRMTRHMLGLFAGEPGAKAWRRQLSERAHEPGAGIDVVRQALERVPAETLDAAPGRLEPQERT